MFDTIADMLRGSAPDDLAHALGTDRTQTRRAMEIGLPALITGLRDKTLEPGGAQNLASMLDDPGAAVPGDLDGYLAAGDPAQGAAMLDVAFGDRGEPALAALSSASGLSTRLLAQVMSVLAPLATGTVANTTDHSAEGLRSYLGAAVEDLESKGFGRVVDLVSPAGLEVPPEVPISALPIDLDLGDADDVDDLAEVSDLELSEIGDVDEVGDLAVSIDADDATVVAGAFPDAADELVALGGLDADLGDPTEAVELGELGDLGDSMPDFDAELASVAPAGVPIAPDAAMPAPPVMSAEPNAAVVDPQPAELNEADLEGRGLSSMGWLWWLIGAVLGLIILVFAITQCGGSDDGTDVATEGTTTAVEDPTPDPLVVQRQATLDGILVDYPGVRGEVFGTVAVLDGTVADDTERALLDQAVRAAGLDVQNNVTATEAPTASVAGYSLNDQIDAQPELSTLRALLDQSGMAEALDTGGEFTLFAPTNDAFEAISDQIAELQGDPQALQDALLYHLLVGSQDAAAVAAATELPTQLDGQTISVDASGDLVKLNDSAFVLATADPARNGVLHIVSGVLLPNTEPVLPEELGAALGLGTISFASGSTTLTDGARVELDKVVAFLTETPANITIGGHTDGEGDAGFNLELSQDRADAVKSYLVEKGIPADSLTAVGFGEDQPIAPNDTAENKALNRRIEFRPS